MTPSEAMKTILDPALELLGSKFDSPEARRLLLAIAVQESGLEYRHQIGGPAHGFWQFEMGGVRGVMRHKASASDLQKVCEAREVYFTTQAIHDAIEHDDVLACCVARLLLWTDPKALPDDREEGWAYYLRCWRPGKPHEGRWAYAWNEAVQVVPEGTKASSASKSKKRSGSSASTSAPQNADGGAA